MLSHGPIDGSDRQKRGRIVAGFKSVATHESHGSHPSTEARRNATRAHGRAAFADHQTAEVGTYTDGNATTGRAQTSAETNSASRLADRCSA